MKLSRIANGKKLTLHRLGPFSWHPDSQSIWQYVYIGGCAGPHGTTLDFSSDSTVQSLALARLAWRLTANAPGPLGAYDQTWSSMGVFDPPGLECHVCRTCQWAQISCEFVKNDDLEVRAAKSIRRDATANVITIEVFTSNIKYVLFSPRYLVRWSNLTCPYSSDVWFNHK